MNSLKSISPIDGRYLSQVEDLATYFSEMALMRYRLVVEIEYLIALAHHHGVAECLEFTPEQVDDVRNIYRNFSDRDAMAVKQREQTTNHDVKAVEYFLKEQLQKKGLQEWSSFIHFALTSEDINNLAYSMMWSDAVSEVYRPCLKKLLKTITTFAQIHANQPMLALTHGQSATPTTVGKEYAVFASRLNRQMEQLIRHRCQGKFDGATGTWSAHVVAYPDVDWLQFSTDFITRLGLDPNLLTIQIESHDSLAESFHIISRINTILIDLCRDTWLYISRGIFSQQKKQGEVGSSTMPHKINPIQFENAEGNLGIANAYFTHLAEKLPISRMQRDLTDSTVLRNQGIPLAHSLLACKNILNGFSRLTVNATKLDEELEQHWEVLAEAIQTILRKHGHDDAYEQLKTFTRGQQVTKDSLNTFVATLTIPESDKQRLLSLTPQSYTGLAQSLVSHTL